MPQQVFQYPAFAFFLQAGIQDFEAEWECSKHGMGMPSP